MTVDKDKPQTWLKYREKACTSCAGTCCTMPVEIKIEDLIRLGHASEDDIENKKKLANRLRKEGLIQSYRESTGLFMFTQRPNGDCYYLHPVTRLCQVYEKRPDTCRKFPSSIGLRPGYCPVTPKKV